MSRVVPLEHGQTYHIYGRGNNREDIFRETRNYRYFLRLFAKHICPIAAVYAYCLLRNHFHCLLRIKDAPKDQTTAKSSRPSQSVSNFLNAYAKAFNRAYARTGALFQRPFGRIPVTSERYFCQLVTYIHQNPQKHGFVDDLCDWPYSSYHALVSSRPTRVERDEVLEWFGDVEAFTLAHQLGIGESKVRALVWDDFD